MLINKSYTLPDVGPFEAFKRSGQIMKEKWGESIGASFSVGILTSLGIIVIALPVRILLSFIHPFLGIRAGILLVFLIRVISSTLLQLLDSLNI